MDSSIFYGNRPAANTLFNPCYCPTEPFLWTRPPRKKRCWTMLWPRRMKRTARKTANSNFPIPNEGSRPAGGVGLFESVVIWATSLASQVAAVTSANLIIGNFRLSSNSLAQGLISLRQQGGALLQAQECNHPVDSFVGAAAIRGYRLALRRLRV